jgi:hypothetical protein
VESIIRRGGVAVRILALTPDFVAPRREFDGSVFVMSERAALREFKVSDPFLQVREESDCPACRMWAWPVTSPWAISKVSEVVSSV